MMAAMPSLPADVRGCLPVARCRCPRHMPRHPRPVQVNWSVRETKAFLAFWADNAKDVASNDAQVKREVTEAWVAAVAAARRDGDPVRDAQAVLTKKKTLTQAYKVRGACVHCDP